MSKFERDAELGYEPFADDYRGFDPREDDGARGPLILALAVGVVLIFAGVVWNTYRQGVRADGALPVITADAGPYKRAPDVEPAEAAPDLKRRIYDQIDGSQRPDMIAASAPGDPAAPTPRDARLEGGPVDLRPGRADQDDAESVAPEPSVASDAEGTAQPPETPTRLMLGSATRPAAEPRIDTAVTPVPAQPTEPLHAFVADGAFLVQIAALRSEDAANQAWSAVAERHPALFAGAERRIQRADLGARGVFYRVRVGAFSERDAASGFCDALKEAGEACIVVQG